MPRKRKPRSDPREMRGVIRDLKESGLGVRAYAKKLGIPATRLWYWQRRLRVLDEKQDKASMDFLPVTVVPDPPSPALLTVEARTGRRILVPTDFDEATVRRLLGVIESC